ncbi:MAG: hypothetical protein ACT4N5_01430 [Nitrosopumilaceae archaeon]
MNKKEKLEKELADNQKEISSLQKFRQTKYVKQLLRQLFGEQSFIKRKIKELQSTQEVKEKARQERIAKSNQKRSEKMKRTWRYLKAIQENYPVKMSLRELRSAFSRYKRGLETDIVDVMWRNPSP